MTFTNKALGAALLGFWMLATAAQAQTVLSGDHFVNGSLCVGEECINGGIALNDALTIRDFITYMSFIDTSASNGFPTNDWRIEVNDTGFGGADFFAITDRTSFNRILRLDAGAPQNALYVANDGDVGLGTSLPRANLHIVDPSGSATLRLEETAAPSKVYELGVDSTNGFRVSDIGLFSTPFILRPGAPNFSIDVKSNGNVGLGTDTPAGKLHTRGTGTQLAYFESSDGGAVQVRFRTNSENRRFLAVNNANQVKSQIVFGDNQIQFLGATVAQEWLRISSAGIVSSGPTCNPNPCDATFDPAAFTVPPIAERAALMWENMYLPAVGPTAPEAPFNLTEKLGGVIHELEVAHIYIAQLHDRLDAQEARITHASALEQQVKQQDAIIASLVGRLDAIEAR